jgi:hypothetical protein
MICKVLSFLSWYGISAYEELVLYDIFLIFSSYIAAFSVALVAELGRVNYDGGDKI